MTPGAGPPAGGPDPLLGLPKAELHLHLEGTAGPEEVRALLARRGRAVPPALQSRFERGDLAGFLDRYRQLLDFLEDPADYGLLADRYLAAAPAQGIRHVEFTVSLGAAVRRGRPARAVLEAIAAAAERHRPEVGTTVLADAVRQFGPDEARATLAAVRECRDLGIVAGFGLGGDERSVPAAAFAEAFDAARAEGLRTTVHAGEGAGPESIRAALEHLRPERIAHGIDAAGDAALLRLLVERDVPLDVCVTSNLATGVVARLGEHPLPRLVAAGVRVTLSTDDPGLFGTDLAQEFRLARQAGLSEADLRRVAAESLRGVRLPA